MNPQPTPLTAIAIEAAQKAALIALRERASGFSKRAQKTAAEGDIVTSGDEASQTFLESTLPAHFIDPATGKQEAIGFLGEEQLKAGRRSEQADWRWCVDPIDGTKPYDMGQPFWCVAIVLQKRPSSPQNRWNTTLAVIYCSEERDTPEHLYGSIYWAEKGKGSYSINLQTGISRKLEEPATIPLIAEFEITPEVDTPLARHFAKDALHILKAKHITTSWRRSICYAAMEVLEGKKTATIQGTTGPYEWDLAFELIAQEAGAKVSVILQQRIEGMDRYSAMLTWDEELINDLNAASKRAYQAES